MRVCACCNSTFPASSMQAHVYHNNTNPFVCVCERERERECVCVFLLLLLFLFLLLLPPGVQSHATTTRNIFLLAFSTYTDTHSSSYLVADVLRLFSFQIFVINFISTFKITPTPISQNMDFLAFIHSMPFLTSDY